MHRVLIPALFLASLCTALPAGVDRGKPYSAELERVYGLKKGEVLKRVPRPFIPERMEWYRAENQHQAQAIPRGPDYVTFHWNDDTGLRSWGLGFGFEKMALRSVLSSPLQLKSYEFEGPAELLSLDLAGDWVVRPEADMGDKLKVLGGIVKLAHGRTVRFEKRELLREVIVAAGRWNFRPLKGTYDERSVHLFADVQDRDEGAGGGSGDLAKFLQMLGDRAGCAVIDEVEGDRPAMISWGHHKSSRLTNLPAGPERLEKLMNLLDTVSKQTGLTLEPARRNVPVWVLVEVKPEA